ncbi:MAG: malonate transporter subunit MadL [Bacteroidales bacterium]
MRIYGVALLAGCFLVGKYAGNLLGALIGVNGDVGGVGFAMILLMGLSTLGRKKGWLLPPTEDGILFWSSMYIPVIVAMAATQNVRAAVSGGWVAILAGLAGTLVCFLLVPLIARIGRTSTTGDHGNR